MEWGIASSVSDSLHDYDDERRKWQALIADTLKN